MRGDVPEGAWSVSTHRRAWVIRAVVVAAVATAGLVGIAGPAQASSPQVVITLLDNGSLTSGDTTTLKYTVGTDTGGQANVQVTFTGELAGVMTCQGKCTFAQFVPTGNPTEFVATLHAGNVPSGQTRSGQVKIDATIGSDHGSTNAPLSVQGPAAQSFVPELSGRVVNIFTGAGIPNAKVSAQDSAVPAQNWQVGTDKDGNFKITSKPEKPITPGLVAFIVTKDGFSDLPSTAQTTAGQSITNLRFAMSPSGSPTPSGTPSPGATSGPPTAALESNQPVAGSAGGGGLSWILIAIGAVLVALGIGAIVLLFVRRRGDDAGKPPGPPRPGGRRGPPPGRGGGGPRPPHPPQRRGDPTGAGRGRPGADRTMIARSPLADVPTQTHGRVPPPGYGQNPYASGQYGGQPGYGPGGPGPGGPGPGGPGPGYPGGGPPNYGQQDPYANGYGPQAYGQPGYDQQGYGPAGPGPTAHGQPDPYDPRQRPVQPPTERVDWLDN